MPYFTSIRVEVDQKTYDQLIEEQQLLEENGQRKSIGALVLDLTKKALLHKGQLGDLEGVEEGDELPDLDTQRERLIYIIEDQDLTPEEFAQSLGIDQEYLLEVLEDEDKDNIPIGLLLALCKVYGEEYTKEWIKGSV